MFNFFHHFSCRSLPGPSGRRPRDHDCGGHCCHGTGYRSPEKSSMSICKVYFSKNDDTQNDTPIFFTWNKKVDHPVAFHFCPKNRCGSLEKPSTAAMRSGDFDDPWPCGVAPSRRALAPWALRHGGIPSHRFQH